MPISPQRATVERIDYTTAMRFTRLFDAFGMAVNPSRLLMALLFITVIYISGRCLDSLFWGDAVLPGEFDQFTQQTTSEFAQWRQGRLGAVRPNLLQGVFHTSMQLNVQLFESLVNASVQLKLGLDQLAAGAKPETSTVLGSLRLMLMVPMWLWHAHAPFLVIYLAIVLLLWGLLGGAISRQAAVEAATDRLIPASAALSFAFRRWGWFVLAPLIAPMVIAGLALALALAGVLFYLPILNILTALIFIVALGVGFVMTLLLVGWLAGVNLMFPALACEGTDAFDAVSRSYSYVFARPWRFLTYSLLSLIYGAVTYLFVGVFIYLTVALTQWAVGAWNGSFSQIYPPPKFGQLIYTVDTDQLGSTDVAASMLIRIWVHLVIGVLAAYAITYYFSAYSIIYLLLRKYTDGADTGECFESHAPASPDAAEKLDPAPVAAPAATGDADES